MGCINIILCDDHNIMAEGLQHIFKEVSEVNVLDIITCSNDINTKIKAHNADVLLIDIQIQGFDSVTTLANLSNNFPDIKLLVFTMKDDLETLTDMLRIGVSGYVLKTSSVNELINAIKEVHNGNKFFCRSVMSKLILGNQTKNVNDNLTLRETEILRLVALGKTTQDIGDELFLSIHTVNSHRKNLLRKLNEKNTVGLVHYAIRNNFIDHNDL